MYGLPPNTKSRLRSRTHWFFTLLALAAALEEKLGLLQPVLPANVYLTLLVLAIGGGIILRELTAQGFAPVTRRHPTSPPSDGEAGFALRTVLELLAGVILITLVLVTAGAQRATSRDLQACRADVAAQTAAVYQAQAAGQAANAEANTRAVRRLRAVENGAETTGTGPAAMNAWLAATFGRSR